jgi:hypothetical protein
MTIEEIEKNYTRLDGRDPPTVKLFRDLIAIAKAAKELFDEAYSVNVFSKLPEEYQKVRDGPSGPRSKRRVNDNLCDESSYPKAAHERGACGMSARFEMAVRGLGLSAGVPYAAEFSGCHAFQIEVPSVV